MRNEGDHLAVFTDVEFGDVAVVAEDLALLDFVETSQARSASYHVNVGGKKKLTVPAKTLCLSCHNLMSPREQQICLFQSTASLEGFISGL